MASVLVIDDDVSFGELTKRRLEKEGFTVTINSEPASVIPLIASGKFELVLLDLSMPELNGENLLAVMRNLPALDAVKVVLYSSADHDKLEKIAEKYGARYVTKSASAAELAAEIRAVLDS